MVFIIDLLHIIHIYITHHGIYNIWYTHTLSCKRYVMAHTKLDAEKLVLKKHETRLSVNDQLLSKYVTLFVISILFFKK